MTRVWITDYLAGVGWGMAITRLNHAVLYVRDADRTADFLEESLGFVSKARGHGAVFLTTNADTPTRRTTTTSACSRSATTQHRPKPARVASGSITSLGRSRPCGS